ncbi:MAG TPA: 16S rRNA (cytidine(1402)-2'-O)-methyltransferase [Polyangiaceae bacterium]|nr:16S rRNA (cytidine(1402)-2'-O)-methyltransferase [Polyangiaceae bacterium]
MDGAGTLFLVATPIGNLGDLTERAVETLRSCDRVLAEDTRRTRRLLTHLAITGKRIERLDAHAGPRELARVLDALAAGERVAMVSDAGTPVVSDPGEALVEAAIRAGAHVVPIPGPSAVLAALVASGLAGGGARFRFLGFLPRDGAARRRAVSLACDTPESVVFFEAPSRVQSTLRDLADATPERRACVARELTKVHEEFVRGTLRELAGDARSWVGEIAIVLAPHDPEQRGVDVDDAAIDARIDEALASGEHLRTLAERLAAWTGRSRRELYGRILGRKK